MTLSAEATDPGHPARDHFAEQHRRVAHQFQGAIAAAVESGELRGDVDVDAMAHLLMAALDGLQLHKLLDDDVDVLASIDLLFDALVASYAVGPAAGAMPA